MLTQAKGPLAANTRGYPWVNEHRATITARGKHCRTSSIVGRVARGCLEHVNKPHATKVNMSRIHRPRQAAYSPTWPSCIHQSESQSTNAQAILGKPYNSKTPAGNANNTAKRASMASQVVRGDVAATGTTFLETERDKAPHLNLAWVHGDAIN